MNKNLFLVLSTFIAVAAFAATPNGKGKITAEMSKIIEQKYGGMLQKQNSGRGSVAFVNVSNSIGLSEISNVVKTLAKQFKHNLKIIQNNQFDGLPTHELVTNLNANIAVFIVDDTNYPPMLVAPEDRWALVNVRKLRKGLKDDVLGQRLFAARCRGEVQRAFSYVCGAGSSQYKGNLMDITEVEQIDSLNPDLTVGDTTMRCKQYLETIGVTPVVTVTYQRACKEGWAPQPTNEFQKAIWNATYSLPKKPIKIEFDPKTDTK